MRFVHCADVHLDSPLRGLEAYEGAPVERIRGATRRAFERMIDLCLAEQAAFLIIAGDLYDGDWQDFGTGLYLVSQLARLRAAGIRAFVVRGNHDAESRITRHLPPQEHVHVFDARRPRTVEVEMQGLRVAIHGQSFARPDVKENLALGYPAALAGRLNIGVLHTLVAGREGHDPYAPCDLGELLARGYDYWALGHVHRREVLHRDPWVVYPGSLQGRHVRETGDKGCTVVTVDDGQVVDVEHRPLHVVRWAELAVDAGGAETRQEVLERVLRAIEAAAREHDDRLLALRVRIVGRCEAHDALASGPTTLVQAVRAIGADVGAGAVWVERVEVGTAPREEEAATRDRDDAVGELLRTVQALVGDPAALASLAAELKPFAAKLPAAVSEEGDGLRLGEAERLGRLLSEAAGLVRARLLAPESER